MILAATLIAAARRYLGAPFVHRGRSLAGVDCAGLVIAVARDCGLPHPGTLYYDRLPAVGMISQLLTEYAVPLSDPEPGCIAHLVIAGRPQHLALMAEHAQGGPSLIHTWDSLGCVCEHRVDRRWQRRIVGAWRLRGVA